MWTFLLNKKGREQCNQPQSERQTDKEIMMFHPSLPFLLYPNENKEGFKGIHGPGILF